MVDLAAIREGLATNLSVIADTQISPYMLANPTPPCIQVMGPDEVTYDVTFGRGSDSWMMIVQAFVASVGDIAAQARLDKMLHPTGPESIKEAIESDRTLGGSAKDLRVVRSSGYQQYNLEGRGPVLGAEFTVQVETSNY